MGPAEGRTDILVQRRSVAANMKIVVQQHRTAILDANQALVLAVAVEVHHQHSRQHPLPTWRMLPQLLYKTA